MCYLFFILSFQPHPTSPTPSFLVFFLLHVASEKSIDEDPEDCKSEEAESVTSAGSKSDFREKQDGVQLSTKAKVKSRKSSAPKMK